MYVWEKFFKDFVVFIKLRKVLVFVFGNGLNSYHVAEFFCGGFRFFRGYFGFAFTHRRGFYHKGTNRRNSDQHRFVQQGIE